jgi:hypothetical protein
MKVEIYTLDELVGTIRFDGRRIVCDPPNSQLLCNIATTPIVGRASDGPAPILPTEGDRFINALPWQYRSAYCRAAYVEP